MNPDVAKVVTAIALGFGALIIGLLPAAISQYNFRRSLLLQTILLCFGAGILLATSLVHILPEVREDLGGGIAEIIFCVGFLFVYLADELLHCCCGEAIQHHHSHESPDSEYQPIVHSHDHGQSSYGAIRDQKDANNDSACEEHQHQHDVEDERINSRICHTNHLEPCRQTLAGIIGMLTALSIHSLLEGLAIGIQDTTPKVMILFIAVVSHKLVVAFCLGVELTANQGTQFKHHFLAIFVFSAGSAIGILIGMGIVDLSSVEDSKLIAILQGIAGGTLLYVTLCEVLPREKARWHQSTQARFAGLSQFLSFGTGFGVMTLMTWFITD
ncbi:CLUMA_CG011167, isoform A [Clunio marinus]|uniref:CLUMA_CG011167, isoform A n=1 Tax=Clunio marinus TaxID=568069 RepID=A0A1J1IE06_9DIPT|nr:CLUMA_CG011167, isoform A [Clunio marinus]